MVEARVVLADLVSIARDVGYPVLFALVAIETMGIPVPGETALFTAGILAAGGHLQIELGEPFFERHGPKAVFLGRWIAGLRITAAWLAGVNRMAWPTFLFYNALGGIAWAASIGLLAYFLGRSAERLIHIVGLAGLVAVVGGGAALWVALRVRRRRAEPPVEPQLDDDEGREPAAPAAGSRRS